MVEITLFEIHLENATFDAEATANAPLSGLLSRGGDDDQTDGSTESDTPEASATGGSRFSLGRLVAGLLVLGVVAVLVRRLLGETDVEELVDVTGEPIELEPEGAETEPGE